VAVSVYYHRASFAEREELRGGHGLPLRGLQSGK